MNVVTKPTFISELTLRCALERSAELYGERPALSFVSGSGVTYRELLENARAFGRYLRKIGIGPGDRVAILSENRPEWGTAYFAIALIGAVVVPILTDFSSSEILSILSHSEAKVAAVSEKLLDKIREHDPALRVVPIERIADPAFLSETAPTGRSVAEDDSAEPEIREEDLASIIYTSGTTGNSKGVMLTHRNIVSNAVATLKRVTVLPEDVLLSILPLAHTYECTLGLVTVLTAGASVVYLEKPPIASVLIPALKSVRPTMMLSVPLVIEKIYRSKVLPSFTATPVVKALYAIPPIRLLLNRIAGKRLLETFGGRLRFFGVGGAGIAPDVEKFLREARFPYAIGYGLTETSPLVAGTDATVTRYRSTGPVLDGVEVRIAEPSEKTGEGEIQVRGPNVMKGYFKDPERTGQAFTEDGWFRTGDLGVFDSRGYLYIRGRIKNMILGPSGENIYPEEIEAAINRSSFVHDSLVLLQKGQLVALVQFNYEELGKRFADLKAGLLEKQRQGMEFLNELRKEVNAGLNRFSRITRIIEMSAPFEKTPTNKIKRYLYVTMFE
jgi:long-chain acyl-CoA synthetase